MAKCPSSSGLPWNRSLLPCRAFSSPLYFSIGKIKKASTFQSFEWRKFHVGCAGAPFSLKMLPAGGFASNSPTAHSKHADCGPFETYLTDSFRASTTPDSKVADSDYMERLIREIKELFARMGDGQLYPSAYDTAWVARVPAIDGSPHPQFPQTLEWILHNQSADGCWGHLPTIYDRLLDTLACIVALTIWGVGDTCVQRGIQFIRKHVQNEQHMYEAADKYNSRLCGFGIVFAAMVNEAKALGLELPYQQPIMRKMTEQWKAKLERIPIDAVHTNPTTWLYCLEGLQDVVDWGKIMNLQSRDGSFLGSPAATACVFMETGDLKCLEFLTFVLKTFGDKAPCLYPIDLFERLWAVDTVERLGIDRHFKEEIKEALDYVYRYWNEGCGIGWARESPVADLHDTAMGLRILRLHGYDVSSDVLQNFKGHNGDFSDLDDETRTGIMDVLSLYRCSLVQFPGEKIMEEAKAFATNHLRAALEEYKNNGVDNDLNLLGEVEYALEYGWHANMPRLQARSYIEQLGSYLERAKNGTNHWWLGKSQYKMQQLTTNEKYLQLARLDFNKVQALHRTELNQMNKWWMESRFDRLTFTRSRLVEVYFLAAVNMTEPEFAACRAALTKTSFLVTIIDDLYDNCGCDQKDLKTFSEAVQRWNSSLVDSLPDEMQICFHALYNTVNELAKEASNVQGRDVFEYVHRTWVDMVASFSKYVEWWESEYLPTFEEYVENGIYSFGFEPIVLHSIFFTGGRLPDDILRQVDLRSKSLLYLMSFTARLSNDSKSSQAERSDRGEFPWLLKSYMKDNPGISEDQALNNIYGIIQNALIQLNWEFLKPSDVPFRSKFIIFNSARKMQLLYMYRDGLTISGMEMKQHMTRCLFHPVE